MRHLPPPPLATRSKDPNKVCRPEAPTAVPDVYYMTKDTTLARNGTSGITPNDVTPNPDGAPGVGKRVLSAAWGWARRPD